MEQHEAAIEAYRRVPESSPLHVKATVQTALNLNVLDRVDDAIALLRPVVDADPGNLETTVALGNILRSRRRFEEAAEVYSQGLEAVDVPDAWWSIYYYRGIAYEQTDRWPLAEADFKRALEMYPDQPLVLNYLGYSWIDRGEHLDEAIEMVREAVEHRPEDGYIVDSLGWAYYKLGEYEKAVEHLERAVSLRPDDPVINDHLGDAYWKVGRRLEAMFQWSHARDLDPEPEELEKILAKLENGLPADEDSGSPRERAAAEEATPESDLR
jgi:tetratricopeptide (TPR) repeat protein